MGKINTTFLITGGGGYLGSVLVPMLLVKGYKVIVIDRFFWGKEVFKKHLTDKNLFLIKKDTRAIQKKDLKDVDVVIDLASLSNDPTGEINPKNTLEINHLARVRTAKMAKLMGVKKYILASSCSVYGFRDAILDEKSKLSPITTYAKASALAEKDTLKLSNKKFSVTILRQGTLYGISPRMRFDLVVNTMVLSYFKDKHISVLGGEQWRPLLHVADSARAFIKVAEENEKNINGEIFNVGEDKQNYQIKNLAKLIAKTLDQNPKIAIENAQSDFRSYRVSFNKIHRKLGFKAKENPSKTAKELYKALKMDKVRFTLETKTLDWYKHLLSKNPKILENR
ncbi:MAG: SDR family oxidoreductase [Candidatus Pacebacteria bacterium]|nr:SDR family oxidoreductase [Candidatus Paceibacterota bacterium]